MQVSVFEIPAIRHWSNRHLIEKVLLDLGAQPEVDVLVPEKQVIVRYDEQQLSEAELEARLAGAGFPVARAVTQRR
ncbi:MAG: heavy-metal-associated domain-containing protein [Armatimonadetes bacterium]|nr:heavy-metal-associated domain-containing protein [Armatimonadota bacterium]